MRQETEIDNNTNDKNNLFVRDILTPASEKRHLYITRRLNTDLLSKTVERLLRNVRVQVRGVGRRGEGGTEGAERRRGRAGRGQTEGTRS